MYQQMLPCCRRDLLLPRICVVIPCYLTYYSYEHPCHECDVSFGVFALRDELIVAETSCQLNLPSSSGTAAVTEEESAAVLIRRTAVLLLLLLLQSLETKPAVSIRSDYVYY